MNDLTGSIDTVHAGREMFDLVAELYPICRSITGDGVRRTLSVVRSLVPLDIREIPTGTQVFDWTIPPEWNIRDAYIRAPGGEKVVDFADSNLHVMSYSVPVRGRVGLRELREHLFSLPEHPGWIPYRTSYHAERWGFCLAHEKLLSLPEGEYEVCIDSSLKAGSLTYGEMFLPGEIPDEILLSCHVCHPSLCNDNLSGIALVATLARLLSGVSRRYSYRFLFIPGTIGAIAWLAQNEAHVDRIKHGLVAACVGDAGAFTYKKSRRGRAEIDLAVEHVLTHSGQPFGVRDFSPYGYDERQYCSPGFDLPVGCLTRSPPGEYPEYHTSADNLDFVRDRHLGLSLRVYLGVLDVLENNACYMNVNPKCEPQLGRRGLYRSVGGEKGLRTREFAMLWVLNLSDGTNSLLDIANRSGLDFDAILGAAEALVAHGLLVKCQEKTSVGLLEEKQTKKTRG